MNKKSYIVIGIVVVIVAIVAIVCCNRKAAAPASTPKMVTGTGKETFSGKITAFSLGCFVDGICSVSVDGKKVIVVMGRMIGEQKPVGKLLGVESIGDLEGKIGWHANVYATTTPEGDYSLYGNEKYYVEVLKVEQQ